MKMVKCLIQILLIGALTLEVHSTLFFNSESTMRTVQTVENIFTQSIIPVNQLKTAWSSNLITTNDFNPQSLKLQVVLLSNLVALAPFVNTLLIALDDGFFMSYTYSSEGQYISRSRNSSCDLTQENCLKKITVNKKNIITSSSETVYQNYTHQNDEWYLNMRNESKSWSSLQNFSLFGKVGIMYSENIFDSNNNLIGFFASIINPAALQTLLVKNYPESSQTKIFIVDTNFRLFSSSVSSLNLFPSNLIQNVLDSSIPVISDVALFLKNHKFIYGKIYLRNEIYIQTASYVNLNTNLTIIVIEDGIDVNDYIGFDSQYAIFIYTLAGIGILSTFLFAFWLAGSRKLRIWKLAQPQVLYLLLFANFICVLGLITLVGPNSDNSCLIRLWWIVFSCPFSCSVFLSKIRRVAPFAKSKFESIVRTIQATYLITLSLISFPIILLIFWTIFDPPLVRYTYEDNGDFIIEHSRCESESPWGIVLILAYNFILLFAGCYLSWQVRSLASSFAESKGLAYTFSHGFLLLIIIIAVYFKLNISVATTYIWITIILFWFTKTSEFWLFVPRILVQINSGDIARNEMRIRRAKSSYPPS